MKLDNAVRWAHGTLGTRGSWDPSCPFVSFRGSTSRSDTGVRHDDIEGLDFRAWDGPTHVSRLDAIVCAAGLRPRAVELLSSALSTPAP